MIIDAMDLLYTRRFDGYCLVTSDSDFTVLTAVDSRTNPASTAGTAQHDLDLVSG